MRIRSTLALGAAALTLGVPVAAADPDGYQPQLQTGAQPDAVDRYLRNNAPDEQPDALARYLRNNSAPASPSFDSTAAARHPDSRAVRLTPTGEIEAGVAGETRDWTLGVLGALGGALLALVAVVGASAIRDRRRLVLR